MMCGCFHASSANARRDFCPPERNLTGLVANSPLRPNLPRYARASSSGISESKLFMCATQSSSRFMDSRWCWLNLASRSLVCRLTHPCVGRMSPSRSLRKVDLPAPLGPTMATLESMSRPKSRFSYRVSYPSYPNDTFMTEMHGGGSGLADGKLSRRYGSSKSMSTRSSWSLESIFMRHCACLTIFLCPWPNFWIKFLRCDSRWFWLLATAASLARCSDRTLTKVS
mmetsp:Transcript_11313/g.52557  ORF Transcript_11313/g.52557 Transcript_11313/m.52557 type:complete len:226 (+) Transcript_11313:1740-2417(+)